MSEIKLIKTSSLDMAATLYALGYPIDGINYSGKGDQMDFYFKETDILKSAMQGFWDRKLLVEPNILFWSRKEILTRMHNEKNSQKPDQK